MSTFDEIVPSLTAILKQYSEELDQLTPILVNRDLNGRVRLVIKEELRGNTQAETTLKKIIEALRQPLGSHAFPGERMVLFEPALNAVLDASPCFPLEGLSNVWAVDRLAAESNWSKVTKPTSGAPRIVFFSIKGGVGRSTSLAAAAWALAESGKRVLVLDMDLESPGLSSSLLPEDRQPKFGITDWLVEDLVDNGTTVLEGMIATSQLSHNGDIYVVPAHGADPGEYISKLGRVWMPKVTADGQREPWSQRLRRLLEALEGQLKPDVILIDSRAGIDEVASACVTDLGASSVLLFAINGEQTWSGYRILFRHWRQAGVVRDIRERLQVVGAMIPDFDGNEYHAGLLESSWNAFFEELYDEVPAGEPATGEDFWSFDQGDEGAPHYPWPVLWHRGFAAMRSLHQRWAGIDAEQIKQVFGGFLAGLDALAQSNEDRA
jgi:cellulose biosynthesis protein BcsQ